MPFAWKPTPVAEWLPDQPPLDNPGAITAKNCIPAANAYRPLSASVTFSVATTTAADDYIRGAVSIRNHADDVRTFAGDAKDLYELSGAGWDVVSVSAGGYSGTATQEVWKFAQWGNDLLATNYNNVVQRLDMTSTTFGLLGGSPPRAKYIAVIRDFVVLANLYESGAAKPTKLRWSGFNNSNDWVPSIARQGDAQDLQGGGFITGIVAQSLPGGGGEQGVIIQEKAVTLMTYVGSPLVWRFDQIDAKRGSRIPGSIVRYAQNVYWIGEDDFYVFDGAQAKPLGAEKVVRHFYSDLDRDWIERISAVVDPSRKLIIWSYPSNTSSEEGHPDKLIIYSWVVNRWTEAEVKTEALFDYLVAGDTLEDLDNITTDLDALPYSLDSKFWKGGTIDIAGFNHNHRMFTFSGTPLPATVDVTEVRAGPGRHLEITNLRPLVEGAGAVVTAQVGHRKLQSESATWTSTRTANANGEVNLRVHNRFARVRIQASGTWKHIQGVDMWVNQRGIR